MAKERKKFICSNCGYEAQAWSGKCSSCGEWNTLQESVQLDSSRQANAIGKGKKLNIEHDWEKLVDVDKKMRISSGLHDVDTVLGGGFAQASINLLVGQPGIGKSTITMQIASSVAKSWKVLYVSGEESVAQVADRAMRLGANPSNLSIVASNSTNDIAHEINNAEFDFVIIDSIQTIGLDELPGSSGSVSQITNSATLLSSIAKKHGVTVVLIGHVTKEGSIAGPKILEHMVDVVMQLEGDRYGGYKVLRAVKNRYGTTNEAGIFEMSSKGLIEVKNPSEALLSERQVADGSVVLATLEGTRPLLVEVQALVNTTHFGYPKRAASGFDQNRLNLLIAVLEKRTKLQLSDKDIYINIVGGIKLNDPAADLAVVMAVASAAKGLTLDSKSVVFGEVGLSGEIRHVALADKRVSEAIKLGYTNIIGPKVSKGLDVKKQKVADYTAVRDIKSALNSHLGGN